MSSVPKMPVHLRRHHFKLPPELPAIRTEQPVAKVVLPTGAVGWLVTGYSEIREVLADHNRFGSDGRVAWDPSRGAPGGDMSPPSHRHGDITQQNQPEHGRLRRMIAPAFTPRHIRNLEPQVTAIVSDTLDNMARSEPFADLVSDFALPIPSLIICALLGIPYDARAGFQERAVVRFDLRHPPATRQAALDDSLNYMTDIVTQQRRAPGGGVIGMLIQEHGTELDNRELVGLCDLILLGGFETTAHMISLSSLLLLQNPEYLALLHNEKSVSVLIEELLRYLSVVQTGVPRVAHEETVLAGQHIRRGERLLCWLPSGNRDAHAHPPFSDDFDPYRPAKGHLAFGHGIHNCIGAPLARMELRIALPALFDRFPGLTLHQPVGRLRFRRFSAVYGVESLPVTWAADEGAGPSAESLCPTSKP